MATKNRQGTTGRLDGSYELGDVTFIKFMKLVF